MTKQKKKILRLSRPEPKEGKPPFPMSWTPVMESKFFPFLLAILSGFLLILPFPKWNLPWMAFVGLVPLLVALQGQSPTRCFSLGLITGLIHYFGTLFWIKNTMVHFGGMSLPGSLLVLFILVAYISLYTALFAFLLGLAAQRSEPIPFFMAPFLWTGLELIREYALTGFPWACLAHSQFRNLPLIQISDLTGIYGITFLIVLINATLAETVFGITRQNRIHRVPVPVVMIVLSIGLFGLTWGYGQKQIAKYAPNEMDAETISVAIIQGNIDQGIKWDSESQEHIFQTYIDQSIETVKKGVDLIVWPETATPFYYGYDQPFTRRLRDFARAAKTHLAFGSPGLEFKDRRPFQFNRAYVLSGGEELGYYDKIHLVPFGEYVPLKRLLFFVDAVAGSGIGDMKGGETFPLFTIQGQQFGFQICYEIIFSDLSRRFVEEGADFLVNITNDAWFGRSAASYQHLSMIPFRAIENRVPIVRAAQTGISAIIDPSGRIVKETDIFVRTNLLGSIPKMPHRNGTFFTRFGNVFGFLCLLGSIGWFSKEWFRKKRFQKP